MRPSIAPPIDCGFGYLRPNRWDGLSPAEEVIKDDTRTIARKLHPRRPTEMATAQIEAGRTIWLRGLYLPHGHKYSGMGWGDEI